MVGLFGLTLLARLSVGPLTIDDAYITFRYARNIAEGAGFVYNAGEHVLGTTTPLYTLLLASLYHVAGGNLPSLALIIAALADGLTASLLYAAARRIGWESYWSVILAIGIAVSPLSIGYAAGGMESSLFTLLVVGAAVADLYGRSSLASGAAALATLTRPEGALISALVLGRHLLQRRFPPRKAILTYCIALIPWIVFAIWWFGSPLPQSMTAKAVAYQHLPPLANALWLLIYLGMPGSSPFQLLLSSPPLPAQAGLLFSLIAVLLSIPLLPRVGRRIRAMPSAVPFACFGPLLAGAYALAGLKGVPMFQWYLVPLVPFFFAGLVCVLRNLEFRLPRIVAVGTGLLLLGWTILGLNLGRDAGLATLAPLGDSLVRENAYAAAARLLAPRLTPHSLVALPEIGAFGYVADARILDTVGLVSPGVTRYYPLHPGFRGENAVPPDLIRDARPDFVVGHDRYLQGPLIEADWFRQNYRLVASFPARMWDGNSVLVYERVGGSQMGATGEATHG